MAFNSPNCPKNSIICGSITGILVYNGIPVVTPLPDTYVPPVDFQSPKAVIVAGFSLPATISQPYPAPAITVIEIEPPVDGQLSLDGWSPAGLVAGQIIFVQYKYQTSPATMHSGFIFATLPNNDHVLATEDGDVIALRWNGTGFEVIS